MSSNKVLRRALYLALLTAVLFSVAACAKGVPGAAKFFPAKLDEDDDWGLADANGNMIVSKEWKNAPSQETEGIVYVQDKEGKYEFFVVAKKPRKIGGEYHDASNFSEGLAAVVAGKDDDQFIQYIDRAGKAKIELKKLDGKKITGASRFNEGLAWVKNEEGKYGFIDKAGKTVVKCSYDAADLFYEGLACVGKEKDGETKYGFINKSGKEAIAFKADRQYHRFSEGLCWFQEYSEDGSKAGVINRAGKIIISPSEDLNFSDVFRSGLAVFSDGESAGLINAKGKQVLRPKYDYLAWTPGGYIASSGDKMGVISDKNKEIVAMNDDYQALVPLGNGRYLVKESKKFLIVDRKGKEKSRNQFAVFNPTGVLGYEYADSSVSVSLGMEDFNFGYDDMNYDDYGYDAAETVEEVPAPADY